MASAEIVNQEQASFVALTLVFSHFDKEIDAYMQSLLYSMDVPKLEEGIRRTQAFQKVLDTFAADAQRYQQAGLPRMANQISEYRISVQGSETAIRNNLNTISGSGNRTITTGGDGGPRRCPINMLTEKMNAYRGLLAMGWPPAAAQAYVDWWYGL